MKKYLKTSIKLLKISKYNLKEIQNQRVRLADSESNSFNKFKELMLFNSTITSLHKNWRKFITPLILISHLQNKN